MPKKNIIMVAGVVLLLVLLGVGYQMFFGGTTGSSSVTQSGALGSGGGISKESSDFLSIVSGLRTISIDTSIFRNPAFTQLVDFGVPLSPQPVRNSNPFLPFGIAGSSAQSAPPASIGQ